MEEISSGREDLGLALESTSDVRLGLLVDDLEGPVLHVGLHLGISKASTNEALGIKHGVLGVHGHLVLGSITDQALGVGEGDVGGRGAVALVVGDDFDAVILPNTDA